MRPATHFPMNNHYTVAILGAGRIAAGFDTPESEAVLTHAHAVTQNARLTLVGITDTDAEKGAREAEKWGTTFYPNAEAMLAELHPDIVIIATPDATHADLLIQTLSHTPKLVILEKPALTDPADAVRVTEAAKGTPIIVNFRRRFDPVVQTLAAALAAGTYGKVLAARGLYSKGILHTGSHMVDLARLFFGEMLAASPYAAVKDWEGEPTVSGSATFERCAQFSLTAGDERAYSIFELEILTEKARLRFRDEGMILETETVIDDPLYSGYRILGPARAQATGLIHSMAELAEHAVRVLDGTETPRSTLADALAADAACRKFLAA